MNVGMLRTRWAAVGAAVAVTLGAGSIGISYATSPSDAVTFVPITPCRLLDTRPAPDNVGNRNTPIGSGETHTVTAHGDNGNCTGIPNTATGLSLNVTALGATTGTFLTLWASGETRPSASNLNPQPGQPPIPNAVTTGLSGGGAFDIYNGFGSVNVIIDINGYYTDHNHDDRYYTEDEIDLKTMFAVVNGNGTLRRGTDGTSSQLFPGGFTGDYTVTFPGSVADCGWVASPTASADGNNPFGGEIGVTVSNSDPASLYVQANNSAGTDAEVPFTVIVTCP